MKNEELFDAAVAAVRDETIDAKGIAAAQERVLARLANQVNPLTASAESVDSHQIHGCAGFRALLPAYLAGALAEPKRLLVEDHTRECVGCRRALGELRRGGGGTRRTEAAVTAGASRVHWKMAMAAAVGGVAIVSGALLFRAGLFAPTPKGSVQSIEGELAVVEGSGIRPAVVGEMFGGATSVRTGGDSGAIVTLADGSKVELAERSELRLGKRWDGTVLRLARGSVIVEAAKQRTGNLYVETGDCQVSVVGTIFSVNAGAKGSRVSVIEGEVRVRQGAVRADLRVLRPGDQLATGRFLGAVPVAQEISWSRNAAAYRERLAALKSLGRELDQAFVSPGARTSTRLLDLAPEGTSVYVALPNLSQSLAQAWSLVQQRASENLALADWWNERFRDGADQEISEAIADLSRFGVELGPEIAVAVELRDNDDADPDARPVILATILDPERFSPVLDEEIASLNARAASEGDDLTLRRIADPASASSNGHELLIWTTGDLLVVSPSLGRLTAVAAILESGGSPFAGTPLHARLSRVYGEGTDWLLGVDLASVIAGETASSSDPENEALVLDRLGFADLDHLVIDRRDGDDGAASDASGQNRASLTFREERHGIASWLSTPAPLGALEFVSPAAHVAVAGLLKNPHEMLDDVLAIAAASETEGQEDPLHGLAEVEARLGISFRQDLAAALGGDVAFAFDGPWLPTPSWKLVLEVTDAARLHATVQALVEAWNQEVENPDEGGPRQRIRLTHESVDGRTLFSVALENSAAGTSTTVANGLFVDGYLLLGPSRALLLESATQREAGIQLATSQAFLDLVPRDGQAHFSAVVWQNVAGSLGSLAELLERAAAAHGETDDASAGSSADELSEVVGEAGPGLAVAYAEGREISFVTRGLRGPLGLSFESLLSLGDLLHHDAAVESESPEADPAEAAPQSTARIAPDVETPTRAFA